MWMHASTSGDGDRPGQDRLRNERRCIGGGGRISRAVHPFLSDKPTASRCAGADRQALQSGCDAKFLQNYWGVDLNDERFIPYYEKLKEKKIPLIIHRQRIQHSLFARF